MKVTHNNIEFDISETGHYRLEDRTKLDTLVDYLKSAGCAITSLNIYGFTIGEEGAKSISQALMVNNTLTSFDLTPSYIGAECIKAIREALQKNNTLINMSIKDRYIFGQRQVDLDDIQLPRQKAFKETVQKFCTPNAPMKPLSYGQYQQLNVCGNTVYQSIINPALSEQGFEAQWKRCLDTHYLNYVTKVEVKLPFINPRTIEGDRVISLPADAIYHILSFISAQDKKDAMTRLYKERRKESEEKEAMIR